MTSSKRHSSGSGRQSSYSRGGQEDLGNRLALLQSKLKGSSLHRESTTHTEAPKKPALIIAGWPEDQRQPKPSKRPRTFYASTICRWTSARYSFQASSGDIPLCLSPALGKNRRPAPRDRPEQAILEIGAQLGLLEIEFSTGSL